MLLLLLRSKLGEGLEEGSGLIHLVVEAPVELGLGLEQRRDTLYLVVEAGMVMRLVRDEGLDQG